jgi:hypothetical protein
MEFPTMDGGTPAKSDKVKPFPVMVKKGWRPRNQR